MKRFRWLSLAALIFIFNMAWSQDKPAFSNMDVFGLEWVTTPKISPDGLWVVYKRNRMDIMKDRRTGALWLVKTDGSGHQKLTDGEDAESNPAWSPDGQEIAYTTKAERGTQIFVYNIMTGKTRKITQVDKSPGNLSWSPDGQQIAFTKFVTAPEPQLVAPPEKPAGANWADHPRVITRLKHESDGSGYTPTGFTHVFVVSSLGGTERQLTTGDFHHRSFPNWSTDGKYLFISSNRNEDWAYDYRNSEIYRIEVASGQITALTNRQGPDRGVAVSPDGKTLAYLGYEDKIQTYQINQLHLMDYDGKNQRIVPLTLDRNISNLTWAPDGQGLYYQYDHFGNTKIGYTDLQGKYSIVANNVGGTGVARPYGGGSYTMSKTGALAYNETTPYYPAELAFKQNANAERQLLTDLNGNLLPHRTLGQVEEIWYKSSVDGRDVQGWIVKPPFFEDGKQYPLVVENHGGPISNYGDRFSPEIQLYATAGFVVFYPNPRGSTSYGEEFGNALYNHYPGDDYHDVMDGVDAVLEKGYVSEDSLFVTGGSAGGIMTAWMIGKNNRFRAAAVIKPVMNWISKTLVADNYFMYADYRYPGQPWENYENYWKFSPLSLVGNIETPTLVMVGTSDLRTPASEARQLYHALKIRKIETAYVEIPGAYHLIARRPSQLITKIDHIVAWFNQYR